MDGLSSESTTLEKVDVAVVQGSRHGLAFVRSMLAGLKVGRYRSYLSAERALRDMKLDPPSLVLTDWETRARGGYWLVTSMRKAEMESLRSVPILILTSEMSPPMLDIALESGANSVLLKPISAAMLRRRIESLVLEPQSFVEHGDSYIPESSKTSLETRLRPHETESSRAHRLQLRDVLERTESEVALPGEAVLETVEAEPAERAPDAEEFSWSGYSAA